MHSQLYTQLFTNIQSNCNEACKTEPCSDTSSPLLAHPFRRPYDYVAEQNAKISKHKSCEQIPHGMCVGQRLQLPTVVWPLFCWRFCWQLNTGQNCTVGLWESPGLLNLIMTGMVFGVLNKVFHDYFNVFSFHFNIYI